MSQKDVTVTYSPVLGVLGAVLVVLKLLGEIELAWVWVLAPFWIPWAAFAAFIVVPFVVLGIMALILEIVEWFDRKRRARNWKKRLEQRRKDT